MVLAAPTVLPHIAPARRGLASGAIFMGVGLGIAASGTIVPILLSQGLLQTWIGLGIVSLVLTLLAWNGWPRSTAPNLQSVASATRHPKPTWGLRTLYAEYALNAVGLVPHMIFLVDYVARGLGKGLDAGSQFWVLFGIGAIIGPVITGHLADRVGFRPALRMAFVVEAAAVAIPAIGLGTSSLIVSSIIMGAFTSGIVPLALGRVNELLVHHPASRKTAWSMATTSFALLQAGAAYGMSFLFIHMGGNYTILFIIGAVALAVALVIDLFTVTPKALIESAHF
jgi:MFS family permease